MTSLIVYERLNRLYTKNKESCGGVEVPPQLNAYDLSPVLNDSEGNLTELV